MKIMSIIVSSYCKSFFLYQIIYNSRETFLTNEIRTSAGDKKYHSHTPPTRNEYYQADISSYAETDVRKSSNVLQLF